MRSAGSGSSGSSRRGPWTEEEERDRGMVEKLGIRIRGLEIAGDGDGGGGGRVETGDGRWGMDGGTNLKAVHAILGNKRWARDEGVEVLPPCQGGFGDQWRLCVDDDTDKKDKPVGYLRF